MWKAVTGREAITRSFQFADFVTAFGFMSQIALVAERMDHHPEWSNIYGRVDVTLTTHDSNGVTQNDIDLAGLMDSLALRQLSSG